MWLLPSLNRPEFCREALEAFRRWGSTPGVLWIDGDPKDYDFELPEGWSIKVGGGGIAASLRWFFDTYPDLEWYGWMADDMRPACWDFDLKLIHECEGQNFVYCNGGSHKTPQYAPPSTWDTPHTIPSAMMWGGKLLKCVGWWVPPWAEKTCIDEAWKLLAKATGMARYRHDAVVEHLHWLTGGREKDLTDQRSALDAVGDIERLKAWLKSDKYQLICRRVTKTFGSTDERLSRWRPKPFRGRSAPRQIRLTGRPGAVKRT